MILLLNELIFGRTDIELLSLWLEKK